MDDFFQQTITQEVDLQNEYNVSENEVNNMVKSLKNWIKLQPHLPKENGEVFDRRLKCMLRCNKMSIEKTKKKIDGYYKVRNMFPEFFEDRAPSSKRMREAMDTFCLVPLRKPLDSLTRVTMFRLDKDDVDSFVVSDLGAIGANLLDIRTAYDLCVNECYILDYSNLSTGHILRISPMLIKKTLYILENAYSNRIVGIHFINLPQYAQIVVSILKKFIKEKLSKRIYVHSAIDSLHKQINKKILPEDYSGDDISLEEMKAQWKKFCESINDWIEEESSFKSNENLRPDQVNHDKMEGSFRKLDID